MNIKNLLLITLMLVNTASAMKRKAERHRCEPYEKRNELISFKSLHGFPLTSLDDGQKWAARLSKEELQKVRKQITWQKDKRFTALLRMIGLPSETKRLIVAHIFEDYKHITNISNLQVFAEYEKAADMLCTAPLCDALDQYVLSMQIFQNPEKYSVQKNPLPLHVIFEYAHDIKMNYEITERQYNMCSKKELESVTRVINVFGEYIDRYDYGYQFYDRPIMTTKNFIKQWNSDQFGFLLAFLATYVLLAFPNGCDNEYTIKYNQAVYELNKKIPFESRMKMLDTNSCFINGFGICKFSAGVVMLGLLLYYAHRYHEYWNKSSIAIRERDSLRFAGALVGFWVWHVFIGWKASFSMLLYIFSSYFPEGPLVGTSCMALVYGLLGSGYNMHKMNRLQEGYVWRQNIPELLQRTDIEIV